MCLFYILCCVYIYNVTCIDGVCGLAVGFSEVSNSIPDQVNVKYKKESSFNIGSRVIAMRLTRASCSLYLTHNTGSGVRIMYSYLKSTD